MKETTELAAQQRAMLQEKEAQNAELKREKEELEKLLEDKDTTVRTTIEGTKEYEEQMPAFRSQIEKLNEANAELKRRISDAVECCCS
ncbi:uncharacterized protein MONOS_4229 [Monocercomonoides exilis]|uniref:uncharacterized protein n=1 Tax=Monocercomonoides exilis TaxID=2049356 RepID=UPI0035599DF4|nr:hypothetical protein MONOS_4229 [Monocercomonoides exilis]|eukprot:MONOS_4229.1-p1 / transcript=MONOS_4229.1 / gene=MONOS_4229 / organism=Monocercomonoides_exilis_PA203 / gene_product=unspecified product / transcript_product=unspecified product / location=Mono_scaffold00110:28193-28456(-) / protein_length=88 / sequence_SO=supercontig / SO=protein_coding / is_pseudo=false